MAADVLRLNICNSIQLLYLKPSFANTEDGNPDSNNLLSSLTGILSIFSPKIKPPKRILQDLYSYLLVNASA